MGPRLVLFYVILLFLVACQVSPTKHHPDKFTIELYRRSADEWLADVNKLLKRFAEQGALLSWQLNTNRTEEAEDDMTVFESQHSKAMTSICHEKEKWIFNLLNLSQQRMMNRLCKGIRLNPELIKVHVEIASKLKSIYSEAVVNINGQTYTGESEVKDIMAKSRDLSVLLHTWVGWRNAIGPSAKPLFQRMIEIGNLGARKAGHHDMSVLWKKELEIENLEEVVDGLYAEIQPFYIQLYSYVRGRLAALDKTDTVHANKPLPAHILGNMWAQNWEPLFPLLMPTASYGEQEATKILRQRYSTFQELVTLAQDFFLSLGFKPLPTTFWTRSQFVQPHDGRNPVCHGSSVNFFQHQDVRLLMCGKINEDDFYTLYHEMGHLYYYLAYRHQPYLFQTGANSAFHEAIGDTIIYAAMSRQHRRRLGFPINTHFTISTNTGIRNLFRQALVKIPLLPFSLALEKWRWNVMAGRITPSEYNRSWWDLKLKYQGLLPPIQRSEADFDPAGKFHIVSNTPYIRYFLSGILQIQIFQALCEASQQGPRFGKPLSECDIYGSVKAGDRLRAMMSLGGSQPWVVALKALTLEENPKLDAKPLLDYFRPLHEWLQYQNQRNNYTVGF